jgi:hypothetical protein
MVLPLQDGARDENRMDVEFKRESMCNDEMPRGMGWRISLSILTAVAWMAFIIAWLFFLAGDYSIWENLGLVILSLAILVGVNAAVWVPFGMRYAPPGEMRKMGAMRGLASAVIGVSVCIFLIYWLLTWADDYTVYQNLAVLLIALVIGGGVNAAIWTGHRHW